MPLLSIIIPCYYNEKNIPVTSKRLIECEKIFPPGTEFEYVMVDDGSRDNTFNELVKFHDAYPDRVKVVKLAGNVGSYNAILAGMNAATGDCNCVTTADLQDPPELMAEMYRHWLKGIKLVMANRLKRDESIFKTFFSNLYHYLVRKLAMKNIPKGGFDFVLFDKQLREQIVKMNERNTNTLYLLPWLGYEYVTIPYEKKAREIGKSRWTLQKKINLFIDSFISFTVFPLRIVTIAGLFLGIGSILYALIVIALKLTGNIEVEGWTAMMLVFLFISSFQMVSLGIIGEYLWRTMDSSRNRPVFVIDKVVDTEKKAPPTL